MFSKKKFLASRKFDIVEAQRKSFISVLDRAIQELNKGEDAKAD